jgi:hypothetical protein
LKLLVHGLIDATTASDSVPAEPILRLNVGRHSTFDCTVPRTVTLKAFPAAGVATENGAVTYVSTAVIGPEDVSVVDVMFASPKAFVKFTL